MEMNYGVVGDCCIGSLLPFNIFAAGSAADVKGWPSDKMCEPPS
jgi:hypothetical protein